MKEKVVIENSCFRYEIGSDGKNLHFTDQATGKDYLDLKSVCCLCTVHEFIYPCEYGSYLMNFGTLTESNEITFDCKGAEGINSRVQVTVISEGK